MLVSYAGVYTMVHGDIGHRYRLPIEPYLLIFGAFLLIEGLRGIAGQPRVKRDDQASV
jgi:hypothetical protein